MDYNHKSSCQIPGAKTEKQLPVLKYQVPNKRQRREKREELKEADKEAVASSQVPNTS